MKEQPRNDRTDTDWGKGTFPQNVDSSIVWEKEGVIEYIVCCGNRRAELDPFTLIILNDIESQK